MKYFLESVQKFVTSISLSKALLVVFAAIYLATMQYHMTGVTKYTGEFVGIAMFATFLTSIVVIFVAFRLKTDRKWGTFVFAAAIMALYFLFLIIYLVMNIDGYQEVIKRVDATGADKSAVMRITIILIITLIAQAASFASYIFHFLTAKPFNIDE